MALAFDHQGDLRLRMADLEKKLAESEEERHKLEKTCDVLIRAFREEEKIHYKTLNEKYEKFLEDCTVRRRRNDIILRSLCRIEDRARAVFAKTERLKLLKDHYVPHIKQNELKKDERSHLMWKTFPQKTTTNNDVTFKTSLWKSPPISDLMRDYTVKEYSNIGEDSFSSNRNHGRFGYAVSNESLYELPLPENKQDQKKDHLTLPQYEGKNTQINNEDNSYSFNRISQRDEYKKPVDVHESFNGLEVALGGSKVSPHLSSPSQVNNFLKGFKTDVDICKNVEDPVFSNIEKSDNHAGNGIPETKDLKEVSKLREKGMVRHQESIEKLKKALSIEEEKDEPEGKDSIKENVTGKHFDQHLVEKDEKNERNEKDRGGIKRNARDNFGSEIVMTPVTQSNSPQHRAVEENNSINKSRESDSEELNQKENNSNDGLPKDLGTLPMGLDGVDYQNETYPESYYEQPVHQHNYSSIASDVILEEDESEQDLDEALPSDAESKTQQNMFDGGDKNRQSSHMPNMNCSEPYRSENHQREEAELDAFYSPKEGRTPSGNFQHTSLKSEGDAKGRDSDSEKSSGRESRFSRMDPDQSTVLSDEPKSDRPAEGSDRATKTHVTQSNLVHLLESDSESFQIEHGDRVSVNDDSDFDFSFHQN